jgi:glycosyltransferase involved in cell wall biosynthesis
VLYVATETPLGVAGIWAAHRAGVPVVSGFHTNFHTYLSDYHLTGLQPVAEALLRVVHNHTARTLAQSRDTAEMLTRMGVQNAGVLDHGVDSRTFSPLARDPALRRSWGADENTPVAIHVGRLAAEKNLQLLQRAFAVFLEVHPHGRCVIVGDGPSSAEIRDACPKAVFAGMRKGEELARHYASGDVGIFPSTSETFGNVVLESLASGLVTVTYDYAAGRMHIENGQPQAKRLHYFKLASGGYELTNVGNHDEFLG